MKTRSYNYALLVHNTPERHLHKENTIIPNKHKKTRYALIVRVVCQGEPEKVLSIKYSNNIIMLEGQMKKFISWYDYVNGFRKDIQGNVKDV